MSERDPKSVPAIMIQGTGSNVGKSLIVAGLARAFANRGLRVKPFKPQNMSNNAGVTVDGGEIGRAQMTQAQAARTDPTVHMNPVLLKPESETGAQIIVQGRRDTTLMAREYGRYKSSLMPNVLDSFQRIAKTSDLVIVEGAGSPAETNLRSGDLANMGFADAAGLPVLLVGDIDRGGVIASLVGTHCVLSDADKSRIKGFIINRFRGDPDLFSEGIQDIQSRTGWIGMGIVPFFDRARHLPAEDSLGLQASGRGPGVGRSDRIRIGVPVLRRIANFDDLDPLRLEEGVDLVFVNPGQALPGDLDLVILPGSKSTIADLKQFRVEGWDIDLEAHRRRGGHILGLCGGYQMLGRTIHDPDSIEGPSETVPGLGLLDVDTVLSHEKRTVLTNAHHAHSGAPMSGYEIHLGQTVGAGTDRPFSLVDDQPEGAVSSDGLVTGTYLHGAFVSDPFRKAFLGEIGGRSALNYENLIEETLDDLAEHLAGHLDLDDIYAIASRRARSERA